MSTIAPSTVAGGTDSRQLGTVGGVLRNATFYYAGGAISALSRLAIVAFIARAVGAEGYGLYAAVLALTMYGDLLDLGLRPGVMKWVAECRVVGDHAFASRRLSSVLAFYSLAAGLVVVAGFALYKPFISFFDVDVALRAATRWVLVFLFFELALRFPLALFNGILWGSHRIDLSTALTTAATIIRVGLVAIVLALGYGLIAVSLVMAISTALWLALLAISARWVYPEVRLRPRNVSLSHIRGGLQYAWPVFIAGIGVQIAFNTDALVIGHFIDIEAVGLYTIAFQLYGFLSLAVLRAADTLFPVYAARHKALGDAGVRPWYLSAVQFTFAAAIFAALLLALYGEPVIEAWAGKGRFVGTPTILVLAGVLAGHASLHVSTVFLQSIGRHRMTALISIVGAAMNLGISIALVQVLGVVGVALGTLITEGTLSTVFVVWYTCRTIHIDVLVFLREAIMPGLAVVAPVCALAAAFLGVGLASHPSTIALAPQGALLALLWLAAAWFWLLSPANRASAIAFAWRVERRASALERFRV